MMSPGWKVTVVRPTAWTLERASLEDLGIHVHADDLALGADQVGQEQGDVTGAAADVEHLHPRRDARCGQELAGERAVELVLEDEPSRLGIGATQRVAVCGIGRQLVHVDILPSPPGNPEPDLTWHQEGGLGDAGCCWDADKDEAAGSSPGPLQLFELQKRSSFVSSVAAAPVRRLRTAV
jgi:hypothetical protein